MKCPHPRDLEPLTWPEVDALFPGINHSELALTTALGLDSLGRLVVITPWGGWHWTGRWTQFSEYYY